MMIEAGDNFSAGVRLEYDVADKPHENARGRIPSPLGSTRAQAGMTLRYGGEMD